MHRRNFLTLSLNLISAGFLSSCLSSKQTHSTIFTSENVNKFSAITHDFSFDPSWQVFGHRGAKGHAPENTLLAIETGIKLGANWLEIDIHRVEDELVVMHDKNLESTTNGKGPVAKASLNYIRSLDAGQRQKVPFLHEILDSLGSKTGLNIEIKSPDCEAILTAQLNDYIKKGKIVPEQIIVSSFDHSALRKFKALMPQIKIGALVYGIPHDLADCVNTLGAASLNVSKDFISKELVDDAHRKNTKVFVYTVNTLEEGRELKALGVDGVFSDYPDRLLKL